MYKPPWPFSVPCAHGSVSVSNMMSATVRSQGEKMRILGWLVREWEGLNFNFFGGHMPIKFDR